MYSKETLTTPHTLLMEMHRVQWRRADGPPGAPCLTAQQDSGNMGVGCRLPGPQPHPKMCLRRAHIWAGPGVIPPLWDTQRAPCEAAFCPHSTRPKCSRGVLAATEGSLRSLCFLVTRPYAALPRRQGAAGIPVPRDLPAAPGPPDATSRV